MAIGSAVQRGQTVYIYDERGRMLGAAPAGSNSNPNDGLQGYTGTTVSVRRGASIYIHDERGRLLSTAPAR